MKINMSNLDRVLRIVAASVCIVLYYTGTVVGTPGVIGLALATVLLVTAFAGNCPVYTLLGKRARSGNS